MSELFSRDTAQTAKNGVITTARNFAVEIGKLFESGLCFVGDSVYIAFEAVGFIVLGKLRWRSTLKQMAVIGADSMPLCVLILFFSGMVLGLNTASGLVRFGAAGYVGGLVIISLVREIGPTFAGILVAARAGSAMAAEIGSMAVSEQIDALRALSVSPNRYLVVPRLVAAIVMLPLMTVIAEVFGALGAYWVSLQSGVSHQQFIHGASVFLTSRDLIGGLLKTVIFGVIIVIVGCRQGMRTSGGAVGVGRATTSAVVLSIVLILISGYFMSALIVMPIMQR